MKNCVYILPCNADTESKVLLLSNTLRLLKKLGKSVLLASHYPIPSELVDMADYHVYEKYNIPDNKNFNNSTYFWKCTDIFKMEYIIPSYSFANSRLLNVSLNFLKNIRCEFFVTLGYDSDYTASDLLKLDDSISLLKNTDKKSLFFKKHDSDLYDSYCFGGYIDEFISIFPSCNFEHTVLGSTFDLSNLFTIFNDKNSLILDKLENYFSSSILKMIQTDDCTGVYYNTHSPYEPVMVSFNTSNSIKQYNVLDGVFNNKVELIPGAWWFNILNISTRNIDYSIFVNENGNIVYKYTGILNKQNTESIQSFKKITFNK